MAVSAFARGWLVALVAIGAANWPEAGHSAEFTIVSRNGVSEIHVEGEIKPGDYERFRDQWRLYNGHQVSLSSDGGSMADALSIGDLAHRNGVTMVVADGARCASACGYIWLAGRRRVVEGSAQVGFHAVYLPGKDHSISPEGNALVGAYMARMGFSNEAIAYATRPAPNDIRWLTRSDATYLRIDVEWPGIAIKPGTVSLTRAEVEAGLLQKQFVVLLRDRYPEIYTQLVSDVLDGRNLGKTESRALLEAYDKMRFPGDFQKIFEAALFTVHGTELVEIVVVRFGGYLSQTNPAGCFILFDKPAEALRQMYADGPEDLRGAFVDLLGRAFETALNGNVEPVPPITAADKRYKNRQIERLARANFAKFSKREQRKWLAGGKHVDKGLQCRLIIASSIDIEKDARLTRILLTMDKK